MISIKKAQEEMVGFVVIIALVAVIGVIFLGISLRSSSDATLESQKIVDLLSSSFQITTTCEISSSPQSVSQLISKCSNSKLCEDGRITCEVLEETLAGILEASYAINSESFTRYYLLTVSYKSDGTPLIEPISEGSTENCPGRLLFNTYSINTVGLINDQVDTTLEVCLNEA